VPSCRPPAVRGHRRGVRAADAWLARSGFAVAVAAARDPRRRRRDRVRPTAERWLEAWEVEAGPRPTPAVGTRSRHARPRASPGAGLREWLSPARRSHARRRRARALGIGVPGTRAGDH
jgi:hypothetical protein